MRCWESIPIASTQAHFERSEHFEEEHRESTQAETGKSRVCGDDQGRRGGDSPPARPGIIAAYVGGELKATRADGPDRRSRTKRAMDEGGYRGKLGSGGWRWSSNDMPRRGRNGRLEAGSRTTAVQFGCEGANLISEMERTRVTMSTYIVSLKQRCATEKLSLGTPSKPFPLIRQFRRRRIVVGRGGMILASAPMQCMMSVFRTRTPLWDGYNSPA